MLEVGSIVDGRYRVLERVGEGAMGAVYRAQHLTLTHRMVALKVVHPQLTTDPDFLRRFEREAQNASRVLHPNAVAVYDYGTTEQGLPYLAMEFVNGPSLGEHIAAHPRGLPLEEVVSITEQIASALEAVHAQGIVHRDLKPENIVLTGEGQAKVLDFGIAKAAEGQGATQPGITQRGLAIGTPAYMSPEQCRGEELDGRADQYALGVMVFEMLTGQLPFRSETTTGYLSLHLFEAPPRPTEIRRGLKVPAAVERAVLRALEKERGARFESVGAFATGLAEAAGRGQPVAAGAPEWAWRIPMALLTAGITELALFILRRFPSNRNLPAAEVMRKGWALPAAMWLVPLLSAFWPAAGGDPGRGADDVPGLELSQSFRGDGAARPVNLSDAPAIAPGVLRVTADVDGVVRVGGKEHPVSSGSAAEVQLAPGVFEVVIRSKADPGVEERHPTVRLESGKTTELSARLAEALSAREGDREARGRSRPVASTVNVDSMLLAHAYHGDLAAARRMLNAGAKLSYTGGFKFSWGNVVYPEDRRTFDILGVALSQGHTAIAKELIARGADLRKASDDLKLSPHVGSGHFGVVRLLLAAGADPNRLDKWRPLHAVAHFCSPNAGASRSRPSAAQAAEMARLLLDAGAEVNGRMDFMNRTPLHEAVPNCGPAVVRLLIERGADVHAKNKKGETPLTEGVSMVRVVDSRPSDEEVLTNVRLLLDAGADPRQALAEVEGSKHPLQQRIARLLRERGR